MREICLYSSEGGEALNPLSLPLSGCGMRQVLDSRRRRRDSSLSILWGMSSARRASRTGVGVTPAAITAPHACRIDRHGRA